MRQLAPGKGMHTEAEKSNLESHYQAMISEDTADWEGLACAVVNRKVCELAIALYLIVVTSFKTPINPITNPNPCV
jgi:hypothetical protein